MVVELKTDIFEAPIDMLGHATNCQNTFGAGLAFKIKEKYPEAYEADLATKKGDKNKLGTVSIAQLIQRNDRQRLKYIFNIYTQEFVGRGRQTSYDAMWEGLECLKGSITNTNLVLGLPHKIGSGLGGAKWSIVETMIHEVFDKSPLSVLICKHPDL